ncbi:type IV leader peptidase family protein [Methanobrevibacter cuticularis]|uniref:Type IV leader peptidase family protein n=1 Tax=Methanobrevibacter cuticularis TaxID=47311 RepID=A0A166DBK3_9EURY|nr:prepilin peptidase [Methanobrevibacter cuticularis]KZX15413.1 type IV leader peptidase family protein [Methanobrevibacter cuticularis]
MIIFFSIAITIILTIIAALFDLKEGIIPNKLTYSLIAFGITINIIFSWIYGDISYTVNSLLLGVIIFVTSYFLWKLRLWGGGDVKLITGIAFALPINPILFKWKLFSVNFPAIAIYPFPFSVIFNSIMISFPFLIGIIIYNSIKNHDLDMKLFSKQLFSMKLNKIKKNFIDHGEIKGNNSYLIILKQLIINLKRTLFLSKQNILFSFLFSIIIITIKHLSKINNINKNNNFNFINDYNFHYNFNEYNLIYTIFNILIDILFVLIITISIGFLFSFIFKIISSNFRKIAKIGLNNKIAIDKLEEGMILDEIQINKDDDNDIRGIVFKSNSNIHDSNQNLKLLKSKSVAGLNKDDIKLLNRLYKNDLIDKSIPIKIGIPFGPSIAIGLITAIFLGDIVVLFFNILNNLFFYI